MTTDRSGLAGLADRLLHMMGRIPRGDGVDRDRIAHRIRARRLAQVGAAACLGLGALGLGGWAVIAPMAHTPTPEASDAAVSEDADPRGGLSLNDSWWGECGTRPLSLYPAGPNDDFSLSMDLQPGTAIDEGTDLEVATTLTAFDDVEVLTQGVDFAFLFDDTVVGVAKSEDILQMWDYSADSPTISTAVVPVLACDGSTPLWPGDYTVIASQGYVVDVDGWASSKALVSTPRVTAEPVPFTIIGDHSDNPLYRDPEPTLYPNGEQAAPPFPDNALSSSALLEAIEAAATTEPWDMAPGTSRWIVPDASGSDPYSYYSLESYPRCWLGQSPIEDLPETFAELDILSVEATLPPSAGFLYGWVVKGPPVISIRLINETDDFLPNPLSYRGVSLFLVRDGWIVAEGDLSSSDPWWTEGPIFSVPDPTYVPDAVDFYGLLSPNEVVDVQMVWTSVTPCTSVPPNASPLSGTYTVLLSLEISSIITAYGTYVEYDGSTTVNMWTSLGTIEVEAS